MVCVPDEFKKRSENVGLSFKTLAYAIAYLHTQWCHECGETTDVNKCLLRQRIRRPLNLPHEKPEMNGWCILGLVLD